jgi:ATP-dependent DNA helicase PIF1
MENKGKRWTDEEIIQLLTSARKKKTHEELAVAHGRSKNSIFQKLKSLALDYHEGEGKTVEEIQRFTGLSKEVIEQAILESSAPKVYAYYQASTGNSGTCHSWEEFSSVIKGLKQVTHRSFSSEEEAAAWIEVKKKEVPVTIVESVASVADATKATMAKAPVSTPFVISSLSEKQRIAFDAIRDGHNLFLTGPGGTGKTYLIGLIKETLPNVAVTAMTGCAALLLGQGAKTIHSWAGIGLGTGPFEQLIGRIRMMKKAATAWRNTRTLIIDEISMMTPDILELLDKVGKRLRNSARPFGGLQVVFVGDFFQLPPVAKGVETAFAFQSPVWLQTIQKTVALDRIFRQEDSAFQKILDEARIGEISANSLATLKSRCNLDYSGELIKPTILLARKADVELINKGSLDALSGEVRIYSAKTKNGKHTPSDAKKIVEKMDANSPYVTELVLKKGAQVMLIKNVDPENGLVNGSRGIVTDFTPQGKPVVHFKIGTEVTVDHEIWASDHESPVERIQIPLCLAYALTIHKSQGATLDCALIDVGPKIFECGQAYVALSRVKSLEGLYISSVSATAFRAHPTVKSFYAGTYIPLVKEAPPMVPELNTESYAFEEEGEYKKEEAVVLRKQPSINSFFGGISRKA